MTRHVPPAVRLAAVVGAATLAFAACGSDDVVSPTDSAVATDVPATEAPVDTGSPFTSEVPGSDVQATDAPTSDPTSTDVPTTDAPATTDAAPTSEAPATTAAENFTAGFRSDGLGLLAFGSATADDLLTLLQPITGDPTSDESRAYPTPGPSGDYENVDEEAVFDHPFGRTLCFSGGLCVFLGGPSPDALVFVGYEQTCPAFGPTSCESSTALTTESGVTLGSLWADHADAITLVSGACFSSSPATVDGVELTLISSGEMFEYYDDEAETMVQQDPDKAQVSVYRLAAGSMPFFTYEDC